MLAQSAPRTSQTVESDDVVPATAAFERFRQRARVLLAAGVTPAEACAGWGVLDNVSGRTLSLFAADDPACAGLNLSPYASDAARGTVDAAAPDVQSTQAPAMTHLAPRLPRSFIAAARRAVLHNDPQRFHLLYVWAWRLLHQPALRHDVLDPDRLRVLKLAKAVQRDAYRMRAFVRFRPLHDGVPDGRSRPTYSAWFEPEFDVIEAVAPWFVRRFASMRWSLLTPWRSVRWCPQDLRLSYGATATRADLPAPDAGEALWLNYYRHTFNPARLNLDQMRQHMPARYWHNLPEAATLAGLKRLHQPPHDGLAPV